MSELYDSVDYNNLKFEYVGPTKDVSFYEYKDSKELFNAIKNNQIKFSEVKNKQNEFLNKLSNIKIGKKTIEQKETINNLKKFYNSREEVINFFWDYIEMLSDANYYSKQDKTKGTGLKILTPKQMLQRLPIALAEVKAGSNSECLLNEIRQIFYSLYKSKQITKKTYNNILNSIQWNCTQICIKMDTKFMNSKNSKTPKLHVLILKLSNKLDLRTGEKTFFLSNLSIYYKWKNIKSSYNNNKFIILQQHAITNLSYLMDPILY